MIKLEIKGTDEAIAALEEIVEEMVAIFEVSGDEARGRVNREFSWRSEGFYDDDGLLLLTHEDPYTWAMHIYYGKESFWWVNQDQNLRPLPFP